MTDKGQRIGDAVATLAVAPHVLRHWEDVGLLRPGRLSSGHRAYDDQTIGQGPTDPDLSASATIAR